MRTQLQLRTILYQRPFKIYVRIIAEAKPACRDSRSLAGGATGWNAAGHAHLLM